MKEELPQPFFFTSRIRLYDDYLREQQAVRERLRTRLDVRFAGVLEAVAAPDVRVVVQGWDGSDPENPKGRVRTLLTRTADRGYISEQLPGETVWHSGGYTVTECHPHALGRAAVDVLPNIAAGRSKSITLAHRAEDEMDYSFGRSEVLNTSDEESAEVCSHRFTRAPVSAAGYIDISQGTSRFGPRGIARRKLLWRDLADDGRYVIDAENPSVAHGITPDQLSASIDARIAGVVRAIKDDGM